jgi:DeoR family fructose operon transcriptional repressor
VRAEERQHRILSLARSNGGVDVAKLAADLAVAPETVRRDLKVLEQHGLIRRTHGGAYPVETARFETTLAMRTTRRVPEKRRIAAAAV